MTLRGPVGTSLGRVLALFGAVLKPSGALLEAPWGHIGTILRPRRPIRREMAARQQNKQKTQRV